MIMQPVYVRAVGSVKRTAKRASPGRAAYLSPSSIRSTFLREHGLRTRSAAPRPGAHRGRWRSLGPWAVRPRFARAASGCHRPEPSRVRPHQPGRAIPQRAVLPALPRAAAGPPEHRRPARLRQRHRIQPALGPAQLPAGREFLRVEVAAARDLNERLFLLGSIAANGAYSGFLDGFLNWYHGLLGLKLPERTSRPNNVFAYQLALNNGVTLSRSPSDLFFGDLRLAAGYRPTPWYQTASPSTLTLPTSTGPDGYGRGTRVAQRCSTRCMPALARASSTRGALDSAGRRPTGELSPYQKKAFASGTSGLRFRFWGRQSLFATVFYHSPYYHRTLLPALDRRELSLDFGWLLATRGGKEWRIGMTEDLEPSGPAIDITFRLGASF